MQYPDFEVTTVLGGPDDSEWGLALEPSKHMG
jgi:hypothetical protein